MVVRLSTIKMVTEALSTEEILQITAAQELPVVWFTGFDITLPELHQLTGLLQQFNLLQLRCFRALNLDACKQSDTWRLDCRRRSVDRREI